MNYKKILVPLFLILSQITFAQAISQKEKLAIINNAKKELKEKYHYKDMIQPMINYLDQQWKNNQYTSYTTITSFTDALSKDLKKIAHDEHLNFFYQSAESAKSAPSAPMVPWGLTDPKFLNNGLNKIEILPGDIGYLRIQAFGSFDDLLPAAFTFLNNTQAMIIDLRDNGGGMLSNYVSSYLLPEDSILLNTIFWNDHTDSIFTFKTLNGPRYLNKPVYLLINHGTFSSAEEFAYDLKYMKRATVVGEITGGGANPGGLVPVYTFNDGSRVDMYISTAHVVNPVTKSNWDGKGVQPDVATSSSEALNKAHLLALQYLHEHTTDKNMQNSYEKISGQMKSKSEVGSR